MSNETCDFEVSDNFIPNTTSSCCSNASCSSNIKKSQNRYPKKIGRNDPCPCGSKKKYKKCCWVA